MVNNNVQLDAVFAALSDPTRRAVLERLAAGGATVKELAVPFNMSLPAVSKHLKVLERAGLLVREVDGRVHHMRLRPEGFRDAAQWVDAYRKFWEAQLDRLSAFLEVANKQASRRQEPSKGGDE